MSETRSYALQQAIAVRALNEKPETDDELVARAKKFAVFLGDPALSSEEKSVD